MRKSSNFWRTKDSNRLRVHVTCANDPHKHWKTKASTYKKQAQHICIVNHVEWKICGYKVMLFHACTCVQMLVNCTRIVVKMNAVHINQNFAVVIGRYKYFGLNAGLKPFPPQLPPPMSALNTRVHACMLSNYCVLDEICWCKIPLLHIVTYINHHMPVCQFWLLFH